MRKVILYLFSAITVGFSGYFAYSLWQFLFCFDFTDWNAYPEVSLFLMVGFSFFIYAVLSVIFLLAATIKGGLES